MHLIYVKSPDTTLPFSIAGAPFHIKSCLGSWHILFV